METTDEIWRPIPGYEGRYSVSSHGRVVSHRRNGDLLLTPRTFESGGRVNLYRDKTARTIRVAVVVLLAFIGPAPHRHEIVFRDGNFRNHRLDNLAYRPLPEVDRAPHGAGALAMLRSGLTPDQARDIVASPERARDVARRYGLSIQTVYRIRQGRLWTAETADLRRAP